MLEAYFWNLNFFCLFEKFLCKTICEPIITLMFVGWWRHQNKQNTICFNTDSFWWTLDDLAFRSFCERSHLWTYDNPNIDNSAVRIRIFFCWSVNFFFGSDKLFMTEIKRKRAYNHVCTWYVLTQSKWKYFIYFFGYWFLSFLFEKILMT